MSPSLPLSDPKPPVSGRLFVALNLPPTARASLALALDPWRPELPASARAVAPENWHLTLRFLGDADAVLGQRLLLALAGQDWGCSGDLEIDHLGAFPEPRRATVLLCGFSSSSRSFAHRLAERAEVAARVAGLPAERRPFHPHLTLVRLKQPRDVRALLEAGPAPKVTWRAESVDLMHSRLGPGGPTYTCRASWALAAA